LAIARTGNVARALDALNFFLADVRDGLGPQAYRRQGRLQCGIRFFSRR
jgi:hypothetical protein